MKLEPQVLWVLVTKSKQVPGQWVAHCLTWDIVTQGNSIEHALEMAGEALRVCAIDDLTHGFDPRDRQPAGQEDWALFEKLMRNGVPYARVPEERRGEIALLATQIHMMLPAMPRPSVMPAIEDDAEDFMMPPAWQIADFNSRSRDSHPC